jgi:hypothetical protein
VWGESVGVLLTEDVAKLVIFFGMLERSTGSAESETDAERPERPPSSEREIEKDSEPGSLQARAKAAALMKETEGRGVPAGESEGLADGGVISSGGGIGAGSPEVDVGAEGFCERFRKYSIWPAVQSINGL